MEPVFPYLFDLFNISYALIYLNISRYLHCAPPNSDCILYTFDNVVSWPSLWVDLTPLVIICTYTYTKVFRSPLDFSFGKVAYWPMPFSITKKKRKNWILTSINLYGPWPDLLGQTDGYLFVSTDATKFDSLHIHTSWYMTVHTYMCIYKYVFHVICFQIYHLHFHDS